VIEEAAERNNKHREEDRVIKRYIKRCGRKREKETTEGKRNL
jgi:hypothetical protein